MFDYFTINNVIQFVKMVLNVAVVWVAFYFILKIVKNNSRTIQIFKGILLIFIIKGVAELLGLKAMQYLADLFVQYGPIAIIIIFQPEFRALLEKIGKTNIFSRISTLTLNERERLVDELVKACSEMSKTKTGALISLEQGHSLSDFIKTGTPMNSVVTSELLCSIFVPGTPLHDGAVILQGVKIACAAAYFPPTTQDLATMYGARHRAAVGISEITDSITIIVSEETGNISIAEGGKLSVVTEKSLREFLTMVICQTQTEVQNEKIRKDSEAEKEVVPVKHEEFVEPEKTKLTSIFRTKNKNEKQKETKKRFTKAKENRASNKQEAKTEKIGIANLVEESMPLDNLFDSIVSDAENKQSDTKPKSLLTQVKEESEKQRKPIRKPRNHNVEKSDAETISAVLNPTVKMTEKKPVEVKSKTEKKVRKSEVIEASIKEKHVVKRTHVKKQNVNEEAASLLDDVISPEAIVLNYKSEKQKLQEANKDSLNKASKEGGKR